MSIHVFKPDEAYPLIAAGRALEGMRVSGVLDYSAKTTPMRTIPIRFPDRMHVDVLDLSGREEVTRSCASGQFGFENFTSGLRDSR